MNVFQFLYGTIKSIREFIFGGLEDAFQFLYGTIKSLDSTLDNKLVESFQFLYGTIKSAPDIASQLGNANFNSYMVRLKVRCS